MNTAVEPHGFDWFGFPWTLCIRIELNDKSYFPERFRYIPSERSLL